MVNIRGPRGALRRLGRLDQRREVQRHALLATLPQLEELLQHRKGPLLRWPLTLPCNQAWACHLFLACCVWHYCLCSAHPQHALGTTPDHYANFGPCGRATLTLTMSPKRKASSQRL